MKKCGIYGIKNTITGKWCIGQSVDILHRKDNHFSLLRLGKHYNKHLQNSVSKYGLNNFELHILEEIPENMLDVRECAWIEYYHSDNNKFGYNLRIGGHKNHHPSKETIAKLSAIRGKKHWAYGTHLSGKRKFQMSLFRKGKFKGKDNPFYGKHHCAKLNRKNSENHKGSKNNFWGKKHSRKTKKKISIAVNRYNLRKKLSHES